MFAMPNVQPQNPIEIDGVAFVSVLDDRIKALRAKYPNYDSYPNQFSNEFGVKLNPSTIVVWEATPPIYKRVDLGELSGRHRDLLNFQDLGTYLAVRRPHGRSAIFQHFQLLPLASRQELPKRRNPEHRHCRYPAAL